MAEPTLLLMDEPFLGLSREVRDRLLSVIEGTLKGRATILLAEHDAEGAYRLLDRYVILRNGSLVHEGRRSDVADAKELVSLLYRHFRPGEPRGDDRRGRTKGKAMNGKTGGETGNGGREPVSVTVTLPSALVDQLKEFCRNYRVTRDIVVERALIEYFREGDMSH